jgi:1,4-alpha-glucan branching enzyme
MYEKFGAEVKEKQVTFRLFFPDSAVDPSQYTRGGHPRIREIRILGDFQSNIGGRDWDVHSAPLMIKTPHPNGWLYVYEINQDLPEGFYQYKYHVTFENGDTRLVSDPCTKYSSGGAGENAAFVIGGNRTTVNPIPRRLPPKDLIIYEMMIDDFTSEFRGSRAPVDAVRDKLDYLQDLGINAIEFMPWTAWPGGSFNWGYEPFQFFSVEYRYVHDDSVPSDKLYKLKTLINELHSRHIHVIMDGVFNHVKAGEREDQGFPYLWLYQNPYESPYIGKFEEALFFQDIDYNNKCTQEFIRDVCVYWLEEYELDGIRFDYTLGFYREGDFEHGISKLISDIKAYLDQRGKGHVALMIEHLNGFAAIEDTNQICATGNWFDPFMHRVHEYAKHSYVDGEILRILNANLHYGEGKSPVTYIENHDHSTVVNVAGGRDVWFQTQPAAIALLTCPGIVLVHNGQEFGEDYCLTPFGQDENRHPCGRRVSPRPLRWNSHSRDSVGKTLYAFYRQLLRIRKDHPALRSPNFFPWPPDSTLMTQEGYGVHTGKGVVIYHRWGQGDDGEMEKFIIILNFSDVNQQVDIPFSENGQWEELLKGDSVRVTGFHLYGQLIGSNYGRIYYRKG